MRLSTARDRDDARAVDTIAEAIAAGATLLDTADAYAIDDADAGHSERMVARALVDCLGAPLRSLQGADGAELVERAQLASLHGSAGGRVTPPERSASLRAGERSGFALATPRLIVATKAGIRRPRGAWVPDGRARHIAAACEASRRALGVDVLDLLQLHTPDPKTPLATSVRALADLRERGLVRAIGLCNVNRDQIEHALSVAPIDVVQVELSWLCDAPIRGGVLELCAAREIALLAHTPLGGPTGVARLRRDPALRAIAAARGADPAQIALAYLCALHPAITPVPGASRPDTARAAVHAQAIALEPAERAVLDAAFAASRIVTSTRAGRRPTAPRAEVAIVMGCPGAGKTTLARELEQDGWVRLNRDTRGGRVQDLIPALDAALAHGAGRVVLDNTYPTRAERNRVIETAWQRGAEVRCVWIDTSVEDAQINAVDRMLVEHGRLLAGAELTRKQRSDAVAFRPDAQFKYRRALEPPHPDEGFVAIERRGFERRWGDAHIHGALIVALAALWTSRSGARAPLTPDDVDLDPAGRDLVTAFAGAGWPVLGTLWLPEIAAGTTTPARAAQTVARLHELCGVPIDIAMCEHADGPAHCWCRKPLPGLGVSLIRRHALDPARCIHVGTGPADRTWAERLGFEYADASSLPLAPPASLYSAR